VSLKHPIYAYPVAVEVLEEVDVTKVDRELVVVALFDDGLLIDEEVEVEIDEELGEVSELVVLELLVLEVLVGESIYISNLTPAPQYSYWFPGHTKLQSVRGAGTEPALIVLPQ
jgi:hypothetical protein